MKILLFCLFFITINAFSQTEIKEKVKDTVEIFRTTEVDTKPQLSKGMYTLSLFISKNFNFDENIKNKKIIIFSSFVIEPDGKMTDIKAFHISFKDYIESNVENASTADDKIAQLDQIESMKGETVRVLNLFNKTWTAAKKGGKEVRCLYNYPINFTIE